MHSPSPQPQTAPGLGTVLFARGFRIFFLLAGLYAIVPVGSWLAVLYGGAVLPTGFASPVWHGHEMLFGYAVAAAAGFLLTAVPNWTGTAPIQGWTLAGLAALWAAGRAAVWAAPRLPIGLVAALDLAFLPVLAALIARKLWPARKPKNFAFVGLLALLFVANVQSYWPVLGYSQNRGLLLAVDVMVLMIVIVGGRITPSFTAGALRLREDAPPVATYPWLERTSILSVLAVVVAEALGAPAPLLGALALAAGAANTARLAGYRSRYTWTRPLLWSLHLGYAWVCLGLLLKGVSAFVPAWSAVAALHALTAGGIGTMTMAVMSRAALGHTGRPLVAPLPVVLAYGLVTAAAAVRVFVPLAFPALYRDSLVVAGALWAAAFALFSVVYAPILLGRRADGQPG